MNRYTGPPTQINIDDLWKYIHRNVIFTLWGSRDFREYVELIGVFPNFSHSKLSQDGTE